MLSRERFEVSPTRAASASMTVHGAVNKTLLLLALACGTGLYAYQTPLGPLALGLGVAGALALGLLTSFVPRLSPITAPLYALSEGALLGTITRSYAGAYSGIVLPAVFLTFGALFAMLGLYRLRILRMSAGLSVFLLVATCSIALTYLASAILGFFSIQLPFIHSSGTFGILFSLFVIVVATLGFIQDFAAIEHGAQQRAPAFMEWYCAFGLLVSLVWLYLEVLRLLAKLRGRD